MTTEERLREGADYMRRQHPRPVSNGLYVDELMVQAADEIRGLYVTIGHLGMGGATDAPLNQE